MVAWQNWHMKGVYNVQDYSVSQQSRVVSEVCIGIYYLHEMNYAIDNILKWPCCLHFFTANIPVFFFFTCLYSYSSLHCNIAFDAKHAVVTYLLFKKLCKLDKCRYTCVRHISRQEKSTWPCFFKNHSLEERKYTEYFQTEAEKKKHFTHA